MTTADGEAVPTSAVTNPGRSTIALAHELGMKVVAEGVEDQNCLDLLAEMGCDTAQGWHVGKAMPADDLERLLEGGARRAAA